MGQSLVDLVHIAESLDGNIVLDDLNLSVKGNTFVTLPGSNGYGKATTLRTISGFEKVDLGKVILDGQDTGNVPSNKRQLNTVLQKYTLFPRMSIMRNIAFGLKIKNRPKTYTGGKIKHALRLVNLSSFEKRSVDSLSDGQQQRIVTARAVANEPKVLLFDEPLGALDLKLRQDIQYGLIHLKNEFDIAFVYVTHDQEGALTMSDAIVAMNQDYVQQVGSPEQIYNGPENTFATNFTGESNIVPGVMTWDELAEVFGSRFACMDKGFGNNKLVDVVICPEDTDLVSPENGTLKSVYTHLIFKGVHYKTGVTAPDGYEWLVHSIDMRPVGQEVDIHMNPFNIQIMNKPASEGEETVGVNEQKIIIRTVSLVDDGIYHHSTGISRVLRADGQDGHPRHG